MGGGVVILNRDSRVSLTEPRLTEGHEGVKREEEGCRQGLAGTKACLVYSRMRRKVHMPRAVQGWGKRSERGRSEIAEPDDMGPGQPLSR